MAEYWEIKVVKMENIKYVGVFDTKTDLFEGQYKIPQGISYNSYALIGEKVAIMDSVDSGFYEEWFSNIENAVGKEPDYLVVHHMEPDHSSSIAHFVKQYPEAKIVSSKKAFDMMKGFFGTDFSDRQIVVGEGDTLDLGGTTLTFYTAPMVHWPEVMVSYDQRDKVLFSADGFGTFGKPQLSDNWAEEARRYYIGIVGKYGAQVQALLKKASTLDIKAIYPLHGPVLKENLGYYIDLYNKWSSYTAETDGVLIAYTSVYGNTKKAVLMLEKDLKEKGVTVETVDLARCDIHKAVADAFKFSKLVLATTTYNMGVFPYMREFLNHLTERNFQGRTVGIIENGSWAPMAAKVIKSELSKCKDINLLEKEVKIMSALNIESENQLKALAQEIIK